MPNADELPFSRVKIGVALSARALSIVPMSMLAQRAATYWLSFNVSQGNADLGIIKDEVYDTVVIATVHLLSMAKSTLLWDSGRGGAYRILTSETWLAPIRDCPAPYRIPHSLACQLIRIQPCRLRRNLPTQR